MRMVSFNVFLGVALVMSIQAGAHPSMEKFMALDDVRECISSSGVSPDELSKKPDESPSAEKLCFFKCVLEKFGMLNDEGEIVPKESSDIPFPGRFPEEKKKEFLSCSLTVGKIESCEDMTKIVACVPKE